ncbi:MAG: hypothetical protein ACI4D3_02335 [Lachnospiraceae bacterium]
MMCRLQKVDFQNISLQERPGGWLAGDFPFDGELYAGEEEICDFLLEHPAVMLEMAANLFYYRELGLSMTKMFYIFDREKQSPRMAAIMNSLFERVSAWYEVDETGRKYLLIQGDGISEACVRTFGRLKDEGLLEPMVQRLYLDSSFSNDVTVSGYYLLEKDSCGYGVYSGKKKREEPVTGGREAADRDLVKRLFSKPDFRDFGSINVSGLTMQELMEDPVLKEVLDQADKVYLYVFDVCLKQAGEKTRKYVKILRWNAGNSRKRKAGL